MQMVAVVGAVMALTPFFVGDFNGAWPLVHVTGGALALFALIVEGIRMPSPQRWFALAGVVISATVISIVTAGGSIGTIVQVAVLLALAAIYVYVVFWPRPESSN
jgi:hypothetical protein